MPSYTHLAYRRNAKAAARKQQIKKPKNQESLLKAREDFGYFCEYESGDIKVNTDELTDAQWFDIGNLPNIPPKISISGRLIASYLEGHLKP